MERLYSLINPYSDKKFNCYSVVWQTLARLGCTAIQTYWPLNAFKRKTLVDRPLVNNLLKFNRKETLLQ